jgi:hypothetical protein
MSTFPRLGTGAIMQYPARRAQLTRSYALSFVDGGEQRFVDRVAGSKRWIIDLSLLTEEEANQVEHFLLEQEGIIGIFSFYDPYQDATYPNCSLESDSITLSYNDVGRAGTTLVVRQNRG